MVADRVADNNSSATNRWQIVAGTGGRWLQRVADGCRWLQIKRDICNHSQHTDNQNVWTYETGKNCRVADKNENFVFVVASMPWTTNKALLTDQGSLTD